MFQKKHTFLGLLILIPLALLILLWTPLYPFVIGIILGLLFDPIALLLCKIKVKRWISALFLSLFIFLALLFFFVFIAPTAIKEAYLILGHLKVFFKDSPQWIDSLAKTLSDWNFVGIHKEQLTNSAISYLNDLITPFFNSAIAYFVKSLQDIFINMILIPLTVFYFLKDKEKITLFFQKYLSKKNSSQIFKLYGDSMLKIKSYVKSLLIVACITVLFMFFLYWIWGLKGFFLLALIAGLLSLIPYAGAFLQILLIAFVQLGSQGSLTEILWLAGIQQGFFVLVSFYIQPKVTNLSVKIHPIIVIACIMVGSFIYGIVGMIFAVPIFLILQTLLKVFIPLAPQEIKKEKG